MKENIPRKCYWFSFVNDTVLFILPSGDVLASMENELVELIQEEYRNSSYFRFPKTNKRIAMSTIKRKSSKCNVLI